MPKEVVLCDPRFEHENPMGPPVVIVGWDRDAGTCQVVTRLLKAEVPPQPLVVSSQVSVEATISTASSGSGIPVEYGFYVDLDRRGLNDLIRKLRRARDQAFGRDE